MNLNELKAKVDELVEQGLGELQVRVYADHGQTPMLSTQASKCFTYDEYMPKSIYSGDEVDEEDCEELIPIILIE